MKFLIGITFLSGGLVAAFVASSSSAGKKALFSASKLDAVRSIGSMPSNADGYKDEMTAAGLEAGAFGVADGEAADIETEGSKMRKFEFGSGKKVSPHSHDVDTLNFVMDGTVSVTTDGTSTEYTKGDAFIIDKDTEYSMDVGEGGVSILCSYWGGGNCITPRSAPIVKE